MRTRFRWMFAFLGLLVAAAPTSFAQSPAAAPITLKSAPQGGPDVIEQTLYSFCSQANCNDGDGPWSSLVMDGAGNLYGTTIDGGVGYGVMFALSPNAGGAGWTERVLYTFCTKGWPCADGGGGNPLVTDETGTLYGTSGGGAFNKGSVFALRPNQNRTEWTYSLIYSFCPQGSPCLDGEGPNALTMDKSGTLYGVAGGGNSSCLGGCGVIFQLAPNSSRTAWTETVLHCFCAQSNCTDGYSVRGELLVDDAGNLYGPAVRGVDDTAGVVFRLAPNQDRTVWTYTVLHSFCSEGGHCVDGAGPRDGLIMDKGGSLYGTTYYGGNYIGNPSLPYLCGGQGLGCGVVFQLVPDQTQTTWNKSVLYRFCSERDTYDNCLDGANPYSGLIADAAGNLYGTTEFGGAPYFYSYGHGTVFRLTSTASGWTETVLYRFCSQTGCPDGANPLASLIMDGAGNLYGSAPWGGKVQNYCSPCGVVFGITAGDTLTVSETGNGRVTSLPAGIDCPGSCGASFAPGTQVTMTASAAIGSTFSGWGGACSGTGSCVVTVNSSQNVTAAFSTNYALAVSVIGSPGGRVTSSPSGIDCGSTCSASFAPGTQVTLTATPDAGWGFVGWSGVCSGIAPSCTVTLNTNTSVAASFATLFRIGAGPVVASPTDAAALLPPVIGPIPQ